MKHIFCNISFENIKKNQMHGKFKIKIHKLYFFPTIRIKLGDCYKSQNNDKIHNYTQFNKNLVLIYVIPHSEMVYLKKYISDCRSFYHNYSKNNCRS